MCVYVSVRNKTISKRSQNDLKTISKRSQNKLETISERSQKRSRKRSQNNFKNGLKKSRATEKTVFFRLRSPTFIESGYGDIRVPKCCFFVGNSNISAPKKSRATGS